jgi:hypothetical protein
MTAVGIFRWVVPAQRSHPVTAECVCDRIDDLAARARPACTDTVDVDEVAAVLEEAGITDQVAKQAYGQPELFALAGQVHKRLVGNPAPKRRAARPVRWDWAGLFRPELTLIRLVAALAIGAADWWLGPNVALPALVGVPLAELMVAWHQGHVRWGLSAYDTLAAWHRHLSAVGWAALTALVPPLLVGVALAGACRGMPADLPQAPAGLLHAAVGVLVAGGYGVLLLLAASRRVVVALALSALVAAGIALVAHYFPGTAQKPQLVVEVIAGGYLLGLVAVAHSVFDSRSYR